MPRGIDGSDASRAMVVRGAGAVAAVSLAGYVVYRWLTCTGAAQEDPQPELQRARARRDVVACANPSTLQAEEGCADEYNVVPRQNSGLNNTQRKPPRHGTRATACPPTGARAPERIQEPGATSLTSPGHVFIVFGDLTKFECDAWAIPFKQRKSDVQVQGKQKPHPGDTDEQVLRDTAGTSNKWIGNEWIDEYGLTLQWNSSFSSSSSISAASTAGQHSCTERNVARVVGLPERRFAVPFLVSVSADAENNARNATEFLEAAEHHLTAANDTSSTPPNKSSSKASGVEGRKRGRSSEQAQGRKPRFGRSRMLIALPVLGTGEGGARHSSGAVIHQLLRVLHEFTKRDGAPDVALVTNERETYAAIQAARAAMLARMNEPAQLTAFPVGPALWMEAKRLAALAKQGKLALFIGAGTSRASGLPLWEGLLDQLAMKAEFEGDHENVNENDNDNDDEDKEASGKVSSLSTRMATLGSESDASTDAGTTTPKGAAEPDDDHDDEGRIGTSVVKRAVRPTQGSVPLSLTAPGKHPLRWFHQLCFLDRARVIEQALSQRGISLGEAVSKVFNAPRGPSLGTCLLASLPVGTAVTTNYDMLFEDAWGADYKPINVLPHSPRRQAERTLLKMHGCVTRPKEIVLTRGHYLGYEESKAALGALVQATLLTKHMLFVGFSLDDDNFHRLFHAVRKATDSQLPEDRETLGTVLSVRVNPLQAQLWEGHLDYISIDQAVGLDADADADADGEADGEADSEADGDGDGEDQVADNNALIRLGSGVNLDDVDAGVDTEDVDQRHAGSFQELCRKHDIFLDLLAFEASDNFPHLLNPRFSSLLTPNEQILNAALHEFLSSLPKDATKTVAWDHIQSTLVKMGLGAAAEVSQSSNE